MHVRLCTVGQGEQKMNPSDANFQAVVGVDWAHAKHDFCVCTDDCDRYGQVKNTVDAVTQWAQGLQERFNGPVAVVLELNKGPLISMLIAFPHITVDPVNPASLAKYRQTFALSRAKDDPSDAFLLVDLFQRHPERLKPLSLQSTAMRTRQQLTQARTELRGDHPNHQRTQKLLPLSPSMV